MQIHSLGFDDTFQEKYSLIGIHTSLEDYKLAYLLNKHLNVKFTKSIKDLSFENEKKNAQFSYYNFLNETLNFECYLIVNSSKKEENIKSNGQLFSTEVKTYLIPEKKKIDFFIKITGEVEDVFLNEMIRQISKISQIITSYQVDYNNLKSKDFLIF